MGRSTKKGPFVEERLMSRINNMNDAGDKQMVKTWSVSYTHLTLPTIYSV